MSITGLSDLESLVLSTKNEKTKSYISEALLCYNVGAYRACIVYTWIAVAFDIVNKIQELSFGGDKRAQELFKKFDTYRKQIESGNSQGISSALRFERELLSYANNNLELIDKTQYNDLIRLQEDRHKCAHPIFTKDDILFIPSAEQARLHMRNALVYLLTQPPTQGKSALNSILDIISSDYFPKNINDAVEELRISPLGKASDTLLKSFVNTMLFDVFSEKKYTKKVLCILESCEVLYPEKSKRIFINWCNVNFTKIKDSEFFNFITLVFRYNNPVWNDLDKCVKNRIKSFISIENPHIANIAYSIDYIEKEKSLDGKIKSFIEDCQVSLIKQIVDKNNNAYKLFADKIVGEYVKANYQWDYINQLGTLIISNESYLKKEHILAILDSMQNSCDRLSSHTLPILIKIIYKKASTYNIERNFIDTTLSKSGLENMIIRDENIKDAL